MNNINIKSNIILAATTFIYTFGCIGLNGNFFGISIKWITVIFFIIVINFYAHRGQINITRQLPTIIFIILSIMEAINILLNISNHLGGYATLLCIAYMFFIFYNLPVPILQKIILFIFYNIILLIFLSAIQGLFDITIFSIAPELPEFTEKNVMQEEIFRFRGIFDNPNSLAIYSVLTTSWAIGNIFLTNLFANSIARNKTRIFFLLLLLFASIYCGVRTYSLQYLAVIFLVLIALRFFLNTSKITFKRVVFDVFIFFTVSLVGVSLFNLYLITPQDRSAARWENLVYATTDGINLLGYGYGQNRLESITMDIGPAKWFLELGILGLVLIIALIINTLTKFRSVSLSNTLSINISLYYVYYVSIMFNWLFQNVIYSPLYITTTIWIILSVLVHKALVGKVENDNVLVIK